MSVYKLWLLAPSVHTATFKGPLLMTHPVEDIYCLERSDTDLINLRAYLKDSDGTFCQIETWKGFPPNNLGWT